MSGSPIACPSLVNALSAPVERTIEAIFAEYGWSATELLGNLLKLEKDLSYYDVECIPHISEGNFTQSRVLRRKSTPDLTAIVEREISYGESDLLEFKSSMLLDRKKKTYKPDSSIAELKSQEVLFSAIKTIAAFCNSAGGTLLIGVEDNGNVVGIEDDFALLKKPEQEFDAWELQLRSYVEEHFIDGQAVNSYVSIQKVTFSNRLVARIQIGSRSQITFFRKEGQVCLYIRSGNRSIPIPFENIEQFFELRKRYA